MKQLNSKKIFEDKIEQEIDIYGMGSIIDILVTICYEKADHVRTNWQDEYLAKQWEKQAKVFDKIKIYRVE